MSGFIYLRDNKSFETESVIKLGITQNIVDRAATYITGEPWRGIWLQVYEINQQALAIVDIQLKQVFKPYHIYHDGGTEFYSRDIIVSLDKELKIICNQLKIQCHKWTSDAIQNADRTARIRSLPPAAKRLFSQLTKERARQIIARLRVKRKAHSMVIGMRYHGPNEQQRDVLSKINQFYTQHRAGRIHWACGLGKALLSVLIMRKLNEPNGHNGTNKPGTNINESNGHKSQIKTVLIGVPSITLQRQMQDEIYKIYPSACVTLINGIIPNNNIEQAENPIFYITTYHSSQAAAGFISDNKIKIDFKIADEYHHIAQNTNGDIGFAAFDKIISDRALYLSATPPLDPLEPLEPLPNDDDLDLKYGPVIDTRSIQWAIEHKKITDYCLIVCQPTLKYTNVIKYAAYMSIKAMQEYKSLTHMLLYTNTTAEAEQASAELNKLGFQGYNRSLHSQAKTNLNEELTKFRDAQCGIISCVYMFGEGFDLPQLNGVCIAAPMRSNTRITQYLLRPNRLLKSNPQKLAHIVLPMLDNYEMIRDIVAQMRQVDQLVGDKIRCLTVPCSAIANHNNAQGEKTHGAVDCLTVLKLRLIHSQALKSGLSAAQDEYNYIKSLNQLHNIKSRTEYILLTVDLDLICDPEEYFKASGVWIDWADFLNCPVALSLNEWRTFCYEKKIYTLSNYTAACNIYEFLPKNPEDIYLDFKGWRNEMDKKILRR
jgi:superfamily II DNA or RNA helicase